jgi:hypothetical protein
MALGRNGLTSLNGSPFGNIWHCFQIADFCTSLCFVGECNAIATALPNAGPHGSIAQGSSPFSHRTLTRRRLAAHFLEISSPPLLTFFDMLHVHTSDLC